MLAVAVELAAAVEAVEEDWTGANFPPTTGLPGTFGEAIGSGWSAVLTPLFAAGVACTPVSSVRVFSVLGVETVDAVLSAVSLSSAGVVWTAGAALIACASPSAASSATGAGWGAGLDGTFAACTPALSIRLSFISVTELLAAGACCV